MTDTSGLEKEYKDEAIPSNTELRYGFCKDWVEKQNIEGSRKLSQQNKNDIQFIIQTNAERKKFLLSTAEDDATVPGGIGEPSVEPKAVPLHRLRKDVRMECEWLSCNLSFDDYQKFQAHCRDHTTDLNVSEEEGKIFFTCLWDVCKHKTSDFDEMCRHINFHAYHARLLAIGYNARATLNLAQCKKDSSKRNQLPLLKNDFCCLWVGCEEKFKSIQVFLDHVAAHVHCAPARAACAWAGCGGAFPRRALLAAHARSHTGERLLACYHCGAHFACNRKLMDHLRRQNVLSSEYTCSVCGLSYGSEYLLRQHARQHVCQHACTRCDMTAPTLATLAQHVRYRHIGAACRVHACPHCKYKAITKSDLRKHMSTHSRKSARPQRGGAGGAGGARRAGRRYACHMCPARQARVFARGSRLTAHLVRVHGARWPCGHSRFRYQISEDGMYRLTTTRYEILEVSKKIVDGYSGPKDEEFSNSFEFVLKEKAKATPTSPACFEINLKSDSDTVKSESKRDDNSVEITMCDVDEQGNIICSEIIKSDVFYTCSNKHITQTTSTRLPF